MKNFYFRDCKVSARNVVLREFDKDGFVIVTDSRSKKVDNLENVPYAAMCFLWFYINEQEQEITKQVINFASLISRLLCIYGNIKRRDVNWEELKQRHDEVLDSIRKGENDLPMPDHFVGYKLFPTMMEFYFARDYLIGDRILYQKNKSNDSWENHHIAA
ncbi:hypothetical protein E2986_03568 [Frieseomelitta varia]|uniref:pyridoxal 5'-phosphate synthase n=1 Tax=Frieseomelitta varia TaxID=561572 RepID=A0A833S3H0_9HYME|nr:hypothetical protein E2986_03568 [Frieseomelitta varia]